MATAFSSPIDQESVIFVSEEIIAADQLAWNKLGLCNGSIGEARVSPRQCDGERSTRLGNPKFSIEALASSSNVFFERKTSNMPILVNTAS